MSVRVMWLCDQCGEARSKELDGPQPLITPLGWSSTWAIGVWSHTCATCAGGIELPGFGSDDDDTAPSTDQREDG